MLRGNAINQFKSNLKAYVSKDLKHLKKHLINRGVRDSKKIVELQKIVYRLERKYEKSEWLTTRQLFEEYGIDKNELYRMRKKGLSAYKEDPNNPKVKVRIKRKDVDDYLRNNWKRC